jgi:uncharacterized protein (DUF305 family)
MKTILINAVALFALSAPAMAQHDHGSSAAAGSSPAASQGHGHMPMMQAQGGGMMQGQGGMMHGRGGMQGQGGMSQSAQSEATRGYMAAMEKMDRPMMEAAQDSDPDAAFVKAMIPHHQGAIDMARVVLQHGKDEQAKKWANDVIREQQRELAEMQEWLKKRGK